MRAAGAVVGVRAQACELPAQQAGDVLVTEMWKLDDGRISVSTLVEGKPDPVLTQCWALIE
mgnify:CR=1 FL=1